MICFGNSIYIFGLASSLMIDGLATPPFGHGDTALVKINEQGHLDLSTDIPKKSAAVAAVDEDLSFTRGTDHSSLVDLATASQLAIFLGSGGCSFSATLECLGRNVVPTRRRPWWLASSGGGL